MSETDLASLMPIRAALNSIPNGKRGALLIAATTNGAVVRLEAKLGDVWSVEAAAEWNKDNGPIATVKVTAVW